MIRRYSVTVAGAARIVEVEEGADGATIVRTDGRERRLDVRSGDGALSWRDGTRVVEAWVEGALPRLTVTVRGTTMAAEVADARASALAEVVRDRPRPAGPLTVRAPMPGRVARVLVKEGDDVSAAGSLVVVEAMKMENEIRAPRAGKVQAVRCAEGDNVESGQELVILA